MERQGYYFGKDKTKGMETKLTILVDTCIFIEDISRIAHDLIIKYTKSHNLQIPDALIAATVSLFARFQCAYASFAAPGVKAVKTVVMSPCIGIGFSY